MARPDDPAEARRGHRFFFIHLMKTGGTTFFFHVRGNFATDEIYPKPTLDPGGPFGAYMDPKYLLGLPPERHAAIRCYTGHFSFPVHEILDPGLVTLTVLRDPVERTISFLKHWRNLAPERAGRSLEELYDHPMHHGMFIRNHQARMFGASVADHRLAFIELPDVDDARLAVAKENLARVDVLGLHHRYDELLARLSEDYGWTFRDIPRQRVGEPEPVSASFRDRIIRDNAADIELYEHALDLDARRAQGSSTSAR